MKEPLMAGSEQEPVPTPLVVEDGICHALFAYDVGLSIDLDEAARRITALTERAALRHTRRAAKYFQYRPAPLRVIQDGSPLAVGAFATSGTVELVLYDFGAVSVVYRLGFRGPLADLVDLSAGVHDDDVLIADARQRVEALLAAVASAVAHPHIGESVESYAVFQVLRCTPQRVAAELYTAHAQEMAQLLRAERELLSAQEVEDAVACRISYGRDDVTLVDWDAAVVFASDAEDVLAVLEFGNVELLEMRALDQRLDDALDRAYEVLSHAPWRGFPIPGRSRAELRTVGQMQVDSAILFEGVNNALKLLGDQYLARLYGLVCRRFHLAEWDASILRKLGTLESIYQKLADRVSNFRMEALEWTIVVLIAVSIVLPFLVSVPVH
jgi:hypothetical protein